MPVKKKKVAKTNKNKVKETVKQQEIEMVSDTTQLVDGNVEKEVESQLVAYEWVISNSTEDWVFVTREDINAFMAFIREKAFFQQLSPINIKKKLEEITWFIL